MGKKCCKQRFIINCKEGRKCFYCGSAYKYQGQTTIWTHIWFPCTEFQKLPWQHFFIKAPLKEAEIIFQNRFKQQNSEYTVQEYYDLDDAIEEASVLADSETQAQEFKQRNDVLIIKETFPKLMRQKITDKRVANVWR